MNDGNILTNNSLKHIKTNFSYNKSNICNFCSSSQVINSTDPLKLNYNYDVYEEKNCNNTNDNINLYIDLISFETRNCFSILDI